MKPSEIDMLLAHAARSIRQCRIAMRSTDHEKGKAIFLKAWKQTNNALGQVRQSVRRLKGC